MKYFIFNIDKFYFIRTFAINRVIFSIKSIQMRDELSVKNRIGEVMRVKFGKERPVLTESIYRDTLGVPKKTFRKYVKNESQPRIDELMRIAKWLNVSLNDLIN